MTTRAELEALLKELSDAPGTDENLFAELLIRTMGALKLSNEKVAEMYNTSPAVIKGWRQGTFVPHGIAMIYYDLRNLIELELITKYDKR